VTYKTWIPDWLPDLVASLIITTDYIHREQFLQQHRQFTGVSFLNSFCLALESRWEQTTGPALLPGPTQRLGSLGPWSPNSNCLWTAPWLLNCPHYSVLWAPGSGLSILAWTVKKSPIVPAEVWLLTRHCGNATSLISAVMESCPGYVPMSGYFKTCHNRLCKQNAGFFVLLQEVLIITILLRKVCHLRPFCFNMHYPTRKHSYYFNFWKYGAESNINPVCNYQDVGLNSAEGLKTVTHCTYLNISSIFMSWPIFLPASIYDHFSCTCTVCALSV
jgi:hypothetical protein